MKLTERHIITKSHSNYNECDDLCFKSKNIYNKSLYLIKEDLLNNKYDVLNKLFNYMKLEDSFKELPMKIATATTIQIQKIYKSFFKSMIDYGKIPSKYKNKPEQPRYLHKTNGRFIVSYNYQAISKKVFKKVNKIKLSGTNIEFYTKITEFDSIDCVRIIPRLGQYIIEVCYTFNEKKQIRDNKRYGSIDLGVSNLATFTSNIKGFQPLIFNGKPLKSINQYYNKKMSLMKSTLELVNKKKSSNNLRKLTNKRNNKVDNYLHKASKEIVKILTDNNISKLVIGKNDGWKFESKMSKQTNQNFIQIPHSRFIQMIQYKCEKEGIRVIIQEESYTSKASFLNLDVIPIYDKNNSIKYEFSGYRKSRGLYKINNSSKVINSDVNGSYNILRKAIPNVFANGIEGLVVNPKVINLTLN